MVPPSDNPALRPSIYADLPGDIAISFEFFPPKTEAMEQTLWESVETLTPLGPRFVSVTYGAGGSTRERTHATVARIARDTPIPAAAHLTCVNASRSEIDEIADAYWQAGIRHIVALRGDPPAKDVRFEARPDGYATSAELVAGLKRRHEDVAESECCCRFQSRNESRCGLRRWSCRTYSPARDSKMGRRFKLYAANWPN